MTEMARGSGWIELICGCMFSGKSKLLLSRLELARKEGTSVAVFKHAGDDRYSESDIVTHDGQRAAARPVATAGEILAPAAKAELILIDEGQFFGPELVPVCRQLAKQGRSVIVASLYLDSRGEPFDSIAQLLQIADRIMHLTTRCARCGATANQTQLLTPVRGESMVGGSEDYEPRCSACFEPLPEPWRRSGEG
jgi:thymidine kinase